MSAQHVLQEIADATGFQAAHELAVARAGLSFYIPANPPPGHWLRGIMDDKAVEALCAKFGGETVALPALRDQVAHRVEQALRNRLPVRTTAMLVGLSERRVHVIQKELRELGRLPTGDDDAA